MTNVDKINYALITALYTSKTRGLYSDVYFPIIKYAMATVMSRDITQQYFSSDDIYNEINTQFGIQIPDIVIIQSLKKIANEESTEIEFYNDGKNFNVKSINFKENVELIIENGRAFQCKIDNLEREYRMFIEKEGMHDDKISIVQFISNNTSDILELMGEEEHRSIDQQYATLVFFFHFLRDNNNDLFEFVNRLFWSSVIAAFLASKKPYIKDTANDIRTEYFLDTSVAMGLLKLSTPQNESSSRDVCNIIKSSGGILRIHPMTLKEIEQILLNVETNGPINNSSIASAYEQYNMNAQKIADIRIHLQKKMQEEGVSTFPNPNPLEITKIISEYKDKNIVKLLGDSRKKHFSYTHIELNSFREIHDIFMDDYIRKRRKEVRNNEIWFITNNRELVTFCKNRNQGATNMVALRRVILELWMHNSKPVDISHCVLMESMAHCLDSHRIQVQYKLKEISKWYNESNGDYNEDVYNDFIKKLYRRAKNVIIAVDSEQMEEKQYDDSIGKAIIEAVNADNLHYSQQLSQLEREKGIQDSNLEAKENQISELSENLKKAEDANQKLEEEKNNETTAKQIAEEKNRLYEEREKLRETLKNIENSIRPLEDERKKAFCNWAPWVLFGLAFCVIVVTIILCIVFSAKSELLKIIIPTSLTIFIAAFIPAIVECRSRDERELKSIEKWELKHECYTQYKKEKEKIEKSIFIINEKLK